MKIALLISLVSIALTSSAALASADDCQANADHFLANAGVVSAAFIGSSSVPMGHGNILGYNFFYTQPDCKDSGSIVVETNPSCYLMQIYSRGDCKPDGIPHFDW